MSSSSSSSGNDPPRSRGYGQPPVEHRVRPGEVRNPYGRRGKPKPVIDFLDETVSITTVGGRLHMTRQQALEHFLFARASRGDVRAIAMLENRAEQRKKGLLEESGLSGDDKTAFDRFVRRYAKRLRDEGQP